MDSLIYSLNATLPVFLVIVVGYVLKQIGILNEGFVKTANKFNFVVTLPVLLFVDLSTTDIIGDFDITYVLYCALVTTVAFFGLWIAAKFLIKDKKIVGELYKPVIVAVRRYWVLRLFKIYTATAEWRLL